MYNKIITTRKVIASLGLILSLGLTSCGDYLDIVPDNVLQYEDLFTSRSQAVRALTKLYDGIPPEQTDISPYIYGDDWICGWSEMDLHRTWCQANQIMRGMQSKSNPIMDYWTGTNTYGNQQMNLWVCIRDCDLFVEQIDLVPDMTLEDRTDWKSQAKFLKAYYMFMLLQTYGPIIIPKTTTPDAPAAELYLHRSKIEDCFNYIVAHIDEAIPGLKERAASNDLGQIDKAGAKAIKARVLLTQASPFYNGNESYYANFIDPTDGKPFFPQTYDREKWKRALDAVNEALESCERNGLQLYRYKGKPYAFDYEDWAVNEANLQTIYDLRMQICDTWNEEIIWGWVDGNYTLSTAKGCSTPKKPVNAGGPAPDSHGRGVMMATYSAMSRYFTNNGVPSEDDLNVKPYEANDIIITPNESDPEYTALRGIIQPGVETIRMYMNREPRLYAHLIITGGYYRAYQLRVPSLNYWGTGGGFDERTGGQYFSSGIGLQKMFHPEAYGTYGATYSAEVDYPLPIIRVADLLLMKAEAINEYYGPTPEAYEAINQVRARAGLPAIEVVYSDPAIVRPEALNRHKDQNTFRDLIHLERNNEFAFEFGGNFWDNIRWKKAVTRYTAPVWGWNYFGTDASTFFNLQNIEARIWTITNCLQPVPVTEMNINSNLVQNPGW
jgi:hypothetical protein